MKHRPGGHRGLLVAVTAFHQLPLAQPPAPGVPAVGTFEAFELLAPADNPEVLQAGLIVSEPLEERADIHNGRQRSLVMITVRYFASPRRKT